MTPRRKRTARASSAARQCLMPKCRRLTSRPFGYCDRCWDEARRADK